MAAGSKIKTLSVEKNGSDYFIRIPAAIRKVVKKNSRVTIRVDTKEGPLVMNASFAPRRKRRSSLRLEDLLGDLHSSKKGGLINLGPPVGKETR